MDKVDGLMRFLYSRISSLLQVFRDMFLAWQSKYTESNRAAGTLISYSRYLDSVQPVPRYGNSLSYAAQLPFTQMRSRNGDIGDVERWALKYSVGSWGLIRGLLGGLALRMMFDRLVNRKAYPPSVRSY